MSFNAFDYVSRAVQKRFSSYGVYSGKVTDVVLVRSVIYFRVSKPPPQTTC